MSTFDMFDWFMEHIFGPAVMLLFMAIIGAGIVGLFFIPSCIKMENEQQKQVENCFMQEPRTKECEYILWKYELKQKKPRHNTTVMPMPIMIHR